MDEGTPDGLLQEQALNETMRMAFDANSRARTSGHRLAHANADYDKARAKAMARLLAKGRPAGSVRALAEGEPGVAALKTAAQVAQVDYDTDREEVNLRKRDADIIREQMQRDWSEARFRA